MYSCANYPRGCRGRANVEGGKCADCVVCSLSGHASWTKTNILPEPQTSSPIGSLIAFCAAQGLSQSASLGDPERLSIQGNPPWIMRQTTKEKTTTMTVGTQKILSTGLKQCLGTGPKRTSVVSLPPLFSLQWFNFLLHFSFFSPPLRVLQFIIRLNASPGVSYFSHSFNIFRGRHLFACLFVCLFFFTEDQLSYRLRFSIWHGTTIRNIYLLRGQFHITKMKQKIRKQKKNWFCSIDIAANRVSWVIYRIGSAAGEQWVGLAGFDFLMDGGHSFWSFLLAGLLAWFLDFLIEYACCAAAVFRFGDLASHLSAISSFRTYIPWSRLLLAVLLFYTYVSYILLVHTIWYDMVWSWTLHYRHFYLLPTKTPHGQVASPTTIAMLTGWKPST